MYSVQSVVFFRKHVSVLRRFNSGLRMLFRGVSLDSMLDFLKEMIFFKQDVADCLITFIQLFTFIHCGFVEILLFQIFDDGLFDIDMCFVLI